jgi:malonyl CoA-acyl carrier protein transacylase/SAM-dependent methyltransferase
VDERRADDSAGTDDTVGADTPFGAILTANTDDAQNTAGRPLQLLALSARTPTALEQLIARYRSLLSSPVSAEAIASATTGMTVETGVTRLADITSQSSTNMCGEDGISVLPALSDICFTANTGRVHFPERAVFIAPTREAMAQALANAPATRGMSEVVPDLAFLFTGQGSQWPGMGHELYRTEPIFRDAIDTCAAILDHRLERQLCDVLFTDDGSLLNQTMYTQPALFAIEWALAQLWKSWGIEPRAVFGHSVGEYVALCVAGVWTLEDGLTLIAERGRLMQALGAGWGMTAVHSSLEQVQTALAGLETFASIAAINGPDNLVVSGRIDAIEQFEERLRPTGALITRLNVSHGFHSAQMEDVAQEFAKIVQHVTFREPRVTVISSVLGRTVTLDELRTPEYWRQQIRNAVQFQAGMNALRETGFTAFLEIGPAPVLTGMGRHCIGENALWVTSLRKGQRIDDRDLRIGAFRSSGADDQPVNTAADQSTLEQMLMSLGQLYVHGATIDWTAFEGHATHTRVSLPTYPFERKRFWIETPAAQTAIRALWGTVSEAAAWQSQQGRLDLSLDRYVQGWPILDQLTQAYIVNALVQLGAFQSVEVSPSDASSTARTLINTVGIKPSFETLMTRWLERIAHIEKPLRTVPVEPLLEQASRIFGDDRIFLDYVVACGSQLPAYLTGQIGTLETLFPGGSFQRAEDLYERAPLSAYFAAIGRASLDALVRARKGVPIRVIEIGAGTGATTSALLPVVPDNGSEYHFTDLSEFFLDHAREKFSEYSSLMRYGQFNAEQHGADQGYADGTFDVVVATNVLHATHDLRETLANVRALLAPGGMLILCEATTYLSWFDITTGLIEGWQLFADGLRQDHPLLAAEQWTAALSDAGFIHTSAFPGTGAPAGVLGQHVILAQAPGELSVQPTQVSAARVVAAQTPATQSSQLEQQPSVRQQLAAAPPTERHEILVSLVRQCLARALRVADPNTLERQRRLVELGVDSLMAVEFRNRLAKQLELSDPLPATLVFDHPSIEALAEYVEHDVLQLQDVSDIIDPSRNSRPSSTATGTTIHGVAIHGTSARDGAPRSHGTSVLSPSDPTSASAARAKELENLSEEEAEALLLRRLQSR